MSLDEIADYIATVDPDQLQPFLAALPPDDVAIVEHLLAQRFATGWRATPATFAQRLDPTYQPRPHITYLASRFVDAVEGRDRFQIWNVAARYGKSYLASRHGPAWVLDAHPDANLILTSYGDDLARENAVYVRDFMEANASVLSTTLRQDRRRANRFVTTEGGGLVAAGMNSAITGFGAGRHGGIVIDDPFKNWQDAHSEAMRDRVWNTYRSVLRRRLDDDSAWIIVVHTRWHEDDLTGRLVEESTDELGDQWSVVRLPTICDSDDDPLGRAKGEVLCPDLFDEDEVRRQHIALGSYLTSAMEQQAPSPEEGGEIKRAWFRLDDNVPPRFDTVLGSWDTKLKDTDAGDYVVGQVWGRIGGAKWLLDSMRGHWNQATTRAAIALQRVRHPQVGTTLVENAGYGPEVMSALRSPAAGYVVSDEVADELGMTLDERRAVERLIRSGLGSLLPVTPKGSKAVRARAVAPTIEAGDVHLAPGAWRGAFLDEVAAFPNGSYDDQVDAMSQALARLGGSGSSTSRSTRTAAPRPAAAGPAVTRRGAARRSGRTIGGR